ncbi:FadR/GntR family transcriptional regulator [Dactylosporangium sp. NPDC048998]|uniref:FadR/GntR family transcriptional regulator n=1 Tax=Dactylosporangium sp. NPDC048998 TaxID=3363976 RepID=UPI003710E1BD
MKVVPVAQRTAAEHVRSQLVELIESGEFAVGQRLPSEAELAKSFAVSRSVIREALHSVSALGLTRSYAGKGTFVDAQFAPSQLLTGKYLPRDLHEVRRTLEVPSAALAAERRSRADLKAMTALLARFREEEDPSIRVGIDADFHVAIATATANPLFPRLVSELRTVLQEQAIAAAIVPGRAAQAADEHDAILAAISQRDAHAAAEAMKLHLAAVEDTVTPLGRRK